jgi:hypothetical protein
MVIMTNTHFVGLMLRGVTYQKQQTKQSGVGSKPRVLFSSDFIPPEGAPGTRNSPHHFREPRRGILKKPEKPHKHLLHQPPRTTSVSGTAKSAQKPTDERKPQPPSPWQTLVQQVYDSIKPRGGTLAQAMQHASQIWRARNAT